MPDSSSHSNRVRKSSTTSSSSFLPLPATQKTCMSAAAKRYKYLRRIFYFRQMDFEFAFWQMIYLMTNPKCVYRNFNYRKVTKSQFARDDPAFLVLLSFWLVLTTAGFSFVLDIHFFGFCKFLIYIVLVDTIGVGLGIATALWFFSNKYLIKPGIGSGDVDVEWGYCFDVHLNAIFPIFVILHGIQLFFYHHFISGPGFLSLWFGNTLWLVALAYYVYITFLGYTSLPFLKKTKAFLYPAAVLVVFYVLTLIVKWNLSKTLMSFYKYRVL